MPPIRRSSTRTRRSASDGSYFVGARAGVVTLSSDDDDDDIPVASQQLSQEERDLEYARRLQEEEDNAAPAAAERTLNADEIAAILGEDDDEYHQPAAAEQTMNADEIAAILSDDVDDVGFEFDLDDDDDGMANVAAAGRILGRRRRQPYRGFAELAMTDNLADVRSRRTELNIELFELRRQQRALDRSLGNVAPTGRGTGRRIATRRAGMPGSEGRVEALRERHRELMEQLRRLDQQHPPPPRLSLMAPTGPAERRVRIAIGELEDGGEAEAELTESESEDETEGDDVSFDDGDLDSDDPMNNTYGNDSFVVRDQADIDDPSDISSFGDSDEVFSDDDDDDVLAVPPPLLPNPLDESMNDQDSQVVRSSDYGPCTVCLEESPYDPMACIHCKQMIGCKRCVDHWWAVGKHAQQYGGEDHAPLNHFKCPLCRHDWRSDQPEVDSVFAIRD